jgi:hypothetical protein
MVHCFWKMTGGIFYMHKKLICINVFCGLILVVMLVFTVRNSYADDSFSVAGNSIDVSINGQNRHCDLNVTPSYAIESSDNQALIVSARGYLLISDLKKCSTDNAVRINQIPDGVGILSDINLAKGLYIALDPVTTQPALYLATVAKFNSKKNLVTLSGSYVTEKGMDQLKHAAFSVSGDAGSSIFSPDGQYVAPDGQIDCSEEAYPGVWDIQSNKRIETDRNACNALFSPKK